MNIYSGSRHPGCDPPRQAVNPATDDDAVLVMHHNCELDHEVLTALATLPVQFIGLLGPSRRREDLFKLMSPLQRASLLPCVRSPGGIELTDRGPEAIALSIAAQLQAWRHSAGAHTAKKSALSPTRRDS